MTEESNLDHQAPSPVQPGKLSPIGVFLGMFIWPRRITRALLDAGPLWVVTILLTMVSGARSGVDNGLEKYLEDPDITLGAALATQIAGRIVGSLFGFFLFGALYFAIGRALGGTGRQSDVYHGFARALVPSFAAFLPLGAMVVLVANGQGVTPLYLGMVLVYLTILIWSMVSLVRGLAEAHRFSSWRSLAAFVLCMLVFVIVIFAIVMVIAAIGSSA